MLGVACAVPFWRRDTGSSDRQSKGAESAAVSGPSGASPAAGAAAEARTATAQLTPASAVEAVPRAPEPRLPPYAGHPDDELPVAVPLEGEDRLDHFFSRLALTDLGVEGAITRASQWGDSVIGGDGLTQAIRQRLQRRFGDAGHGFHALGRYSRWYGHRGIQYDERRKWDTCLIIFKCQKDRRYGYAGVASTSLGRASSWWRTVPEDIGGKLSRFELWYQKRPDGGGFEIRVDGQVQRIVDARAAEVSDEVEIVRLPDAEHEIEVAALGTGIAKGYGVVLERDVPGVVWDELALIGSFIQRLDYQDAEHIAAQVRRRDVDLLVFMFGGNDLQREHTDLKRTTEPYEQEYARVIRKLRAGKPGAACLIMSMTDHAHEVKGAIVSRPMVARLVAAQRKVAEAVGCGFYDTFLALGGPGSAQRGRKSKPPLVAPDLRHPTVAGQRHIANLLYAALMHAYAAYRHAHEGTPLPIALRADGTALPTAFP